MKKYKDSSAKKIEGIPVSILSEKRKKTGVIASKKEEIPIGTEVIQVNGQNTKKYLIDQVIPYISSSTDYIVKDIAIRNMFQSPKGIRFDIDLKLPNGTAKSYQLTTKESKEKNVWRKFRC